MDCWFIVQTNPNCETKAAAEMRRAGFRVYVPKQASVRIHHRTGATLIKRRPLMAGYVFMRFPGAMNWYQLRQCQGVKGVLYLDGRAYQMAREHVGEIMRAQRSMRYEDEDTRAVRKEMRRATRQGGAEIAAASKKVHRSRFAAGMHVSAPLTATERVLARIIAITKKGTVKAIVMADGREMPVEFTNVDNLKIVDSLGKAA